MVDIHSHILPAIDDGASDLEESLAILQKAIEGGITDVICTPHFSPEYQDFDTVLNIREKAFKALSERVLKNNININIYEGFEIAFSPTLIELIDSKKNIDNNLLSKLCLAGGRYMLIELPHILFPVWVSHYLYELQLRGIKPVIAHAERNVWLLSQKEEVISWAAKGVIFQINAACVDHTSKYFSKKILDFFDKNQIPFVIASDVHDQNRRSMDVMNRISSEDYLKKFSKKYINYKKCHENAFNILLNRDII